MKIWVWNKKKIGMSCVFFSLLLIAEVVCTKSYLAVKPTANLACDSNINSEWENKIKQLDKGEEKIAYLTFDDGPTTSVTPKILDILKEEEIKASFFVIGKAVEAHPELIKRAYEEGHYIANHGYSHNSEILYKSEASFMEEIKRTDEAIGKAIDIKDYCSHVFRFPNGFMSPRYQTQKKKMVPILSKMEYAYIDWNCLNHDSIKKYTKEQLIENLKKSSQNKKTLVILMHDTKDVSDSSQALKESIHYLRTQGYRFENFYHLK